VNKIRADSICRSQPLLVTFGLPQQKINHG
jgi:hypothetical protein